MRGLYMFTSSVTATADTTPSYCIFNRLFVLRPEKFVLLRFSLSPLSIGVERRNFINLSRFFGSIQFSNTSSFCPPIIKSRGLAINL